MILKLVKLSIGRHAGLEPKVLANGIAEPLGADVIQVIGRKVVLYRHNPELKPRADGRPAWR